MDQTLSITYVQGNKYNIPVPLEHIQYIEEIFTKNPEENSR